MNEDPFKSQHMFARAEDPIRVLQCKDPQTPQADTAKLRKVLSNFFPQWKVDQILGDKEVCPYCGSDSPKKFKIYKHPKDGDCIGIYTCACGKQYVKSGYVHAEVW